MKWTLVYFDDQASNIEALAYLLSESFDVVGCCNATDYPSILEKTNPHIILLDVHMPIMDGHTLYKNITQHPLYNGCPIIFISGDYSEGNKLRSYEHGGIDFLPRNLDTEEIIVRLTNKVNFFMQMSASLELGNLHIDAKNMMVTINKKNIDLTLVELRILSHILRSYPSPLIVSRFLWKHRRCL